MFGVDQFGKEGLCLAESGKAWKQISRGLAWVSMRAEARFGTPRLGLDKFFLWRGMPGRSDLGRG